MPPGRDSKTRLESGRISASKTVQSPILRRFSFVSEFSLRIFHYAVMWAFSVFTIIHIYLVFYHDYVEGHGDSVLSRPELESLIEKLRLAEQSVREGSTIAAPDEDTESFVQAFTAGRATAPS